MAAMFAEDISKWIFLNEKARFSIIIGSDNGLAPTRREAILCTNDG